MNSELITNAQKDGRALAIAARTRLTPADDVLEAVYSGLFLKYLPAQIDDFNNEFYKNIGRS